MIKIHILCSGAQSGNRSQTRGAWWLWAGPYKGLVEKGRRWTTRKHRGLRTSMNRNSDQISEGSNERIKKVDPIYIVGAFDLVFILWTIGSFWGSERPYQGGAGWNGEGNSGDKKMNLDLLPSLPDSDSEDLHRVIRLYIKKSKWTELEKL